MYLTWTALFTLLGLVAAVSFWHSSLGARESANRAAEDACQRLRLQFLDGTVAFAGLRLTRGHGGRLSLRRTYVFDYTADSIERRQGFVILIGRKVESVGFGHEGAGATQVGASAEDTLLSNKALLNDLTPDGDAGAQALSPLDRANRAPRADNVLDFVEWRHRSRQRAQTDERSHGERKG